jgi:hypothetical protein
MPRKKIIKRNQNQRRCSKCSLRFVKSSSLTGLCVQCTSIVNSPSDSDEVKCGLGIEVTVPVTKKYDAVASTNDAEKCEYIQPVPTTVQAVRTSIQEFTHNKKDKFLCRKTMETTDATDFEFSDMPPLIDRDDETTLSGGEIELGFEEEHEDAEERQDHINKTRAEPKNPQKHPTIGLNLPVAKNNATALSSNRFQKCDVQHELLC